MTIKELSEITGVTKRTIQRKAKQLFPDNVGGNLKSEFSDAQSLQIVGELRAKIKDGVRLRPNVAESATISRDVIASIISDTVAATIRQLLPLLQKPQDVMPLQIESKFMTALAYCSTHGLPVDYESVRSAGHKAAAYSRAHELSIQKIADPRYGYVNGYTREALDYATNRRPEQ